MRPAFGSSCPSARFSRARSPSPGARERAAVGLQRDLPVARGERQGRGARHLRAPERQGATRPRVGSDQRQRAGRPGRQAGPLQVRLRGRLGQVPERLLLVDVQERVRSVRRPAAPVPRRRLQSAGRDATGRCSRGSAACRCSGSTPGSRTQTAYELHLSHWSGDLPKLEVYAHWTYGGSWQGLFGRLTYLGSPVHGFGSTGDGNPRDRYGRNVYIDTFNSVYGAGWRRESGILAHGRPAPSATASSPQKPFPGYPSQEMRPPAPGEKYRVTVMGPGVTPVDRVGGPRPDRRRPRLRGFDHRRLRRDHGGRHPLRRRAVNTR